ncbi:hypothetical protein [Corynebacterium mayonis]|uniref:hypothetical protein n=1 Tax=Corynebacterium mayonis TaxID=3062461 RepID=UPI003140BD69
MGIFIGLLLALFAPSSGGWAVVVSSLGIGVIFGLVFAAVSYAFTGGKRDFSSATNIVAGHYDILCEPESAPRARDAIGRMDFTSE